MSILSSTMNPLVAASTTPSWLVGALILVCAAGVFAIYRDRSARGPTGTLRTPLPNDAAPAWIGLGVMAMFYVYTPVVFRTIFATSVSTTTTQPTTMPVDLGLAIRSSVATYLLAILSAVTIHAYLRTRVRRLLGLQMPTVPQLRLWLAACAVAIPLTYLVASVTQVALEQLKLDHPASHPMLDWMSQLRDRPLLKYAAIASATLLAPMFEELFFRGHLQTGLASLFRSRSVAIVVTSIVFASLHPWWTIPPIFVLSLCLGALYERTNNLWLVIALHVGFNAISTGVFLAR